MDDSTDSTNLRLWWAQCCEHCSVLSALGPPEPQVCGEGMQELALILKQQEGSSPCPLPSLQPSKHARRLLSSLPHLGHLTLSFALLPPAPLPLPLSPSPALLCCQQRLVEWVVYGPLGALSPCFPCLALLLSPCRWGRGGGCCNKTHSTPPLNQTRRQACADAHVPAHKNLGQQLSRCRLHMVKQQNRLRVTC